MDCRGRSSLYFSSLSFRSLAFSGLGSGHCLWLLFIVVSASLFAGLQAQTEGDTGYDYNYDDDEFYDESALSKGPTFDAPVTNVTVVLGQTAVLPCSIDYLGKHKVAWLDYNAFPVTYEDRRVIDDARFSVIRPHDTQWNLQIHEVKAEDDGAYRCTVNTNPIRSKIVMLRVCVPPEIFDNVSSHDVIVHEGDSLLLVCVADGRPKPEITWSQRDGVHRCLTGTDFAPGDVISKGERFVIKNITRHCGGRYECEASNGVPPSIRREITVTVEFAPRILMPNRRLGQIKGRRETILNCIITAFPHATNYWQKDGRRIASSLKHHIEAYEDGDHALTLSLRIHDLAQSDYGVYRCVAANALGRDEDVVFLFETEPDHGVTSQHGGLQRNFFKIKSTAAASSTEDNMQAYYNTLAYNRQPINDDNVILEAIRIASDFTWSGATGTWKDLTGGSRCFIISIVLFGVLTH